jgi:hypothetical protein
MISVELKGDTLTLTNGSMDFEYFSGPGKGFTLSPKDAERLSHDARKLAGEEYRRDSEVHPVKRQEQPEPQPARKESKKDS